MSKEVRTVIKELVKKYSGWDCLAYNPACELIEELIERGIIKVLK